MHATERRGCCVEATATETGSTANRSSPDAPADDMATAAETRTTLRLPNQSRARNERDPIEFSFHYFDFLCLFVWLFLKFIISLA
jgi:hypothetical protein